MIPATGRATRSGTNVRTGPSDGHCGSPLGKAGFQLFSFGGAASQNDGLFEQEAPATWKDRVPANTQGTQATRPPRAHDASRSRSRGLESRGGRRDPRPGTHPPQRGQFKRQAAAPSPSARRAVHTEMKTMSSVSANMVLIVHFRLRTPTRGGGRAPQPRERQRKTTSLDLRTAEERGDSDSSGATLPLPGHNAGGIPSGRGRGRAHPAETKPRSGGSRERREWRG